MILNPVKRIKMNKLKFLMIKQRYGKTAPFVLKKTGELTISAAILYYVGTGVVKILNRIIQFCNETSPEEILALIANNLLFVLFFVFFINFILLLIEVGRY